MGLRNVTIVTSHHQPFWCGLDVHDGDPDWTKKVVNGGQAPSYSATATECEPFKQWFG